MKKKHDAAIAGFTLIELLTTLAIITILAAIIIPVAGKVRESAKAARSLGNIKSIAQGMLLHVSDNRGRLPTLGTDRGFTKPRWPNQISAYLPPPYKQPELNIDGLHSNISPVLVDPLVPGGRHGTQADYGANRILFVPGDEGTGLPFAEIPNPSRTVMLVIAWDSRSPEGATWYIESESYISNVNTELRPDDRGRGVITAAFAAGHIASLPKASFEESRAELLRINSAP